MQAVRNFIIRTAEVEPLECDFCFQLDDRILQLDCPCRKLICPPCIKVNQHCRFCQATIEVQLVSQAKFQFSCLSDSPLCSFTSNSKKQLLRHCTEYCGFMEGTKKEELKLAVSYKCLKGHFLEIVNGSCCRICKRSRCKSQCPTCRQDLQRTRKDSQGVTESIAYCIYCRPIPCTTRKCPHNHDLIATRSRSATCDICDNAVWRYPPPTYSDRACDFDVCSNCFKDLPQEIPFLPIQKLTEEFIVFDD